MGKFSIGRIETLETLEARKKEREAKAARKREAAEKKAATEGKFHIGGDYDGIVESLGLEKRGRQQ